MKLSQMLGTKIMGVINGSGFMEMARKTPNDFTRNRTMPFNLLMVHIITSLKSSSASALRRFFVSVGMVFASMRQQSYSEARQKVNVWAFVRLLDESATVMLENTSKTWHGYRVFAIDGSKMQLPTDKKLLAHYGGMGKNGDTPTAQASILYDVQNDIVADAAIRPLADDERAMAKTHIEACNALLPDDKKLIIFDRGYPSFELMEMLETMGFKYVMRVRRAFNNDIDSQSKTDGHVWLNQGEKRMHARVIKFILDSGEEEVLLTNISDKRLGKKAFKKLYFMRWPVETKYDMVKNKLQIENFSARTVEGVQQDFYATMLLANFVAAAAHDVIEDIQEARKDKDNKYTYKANINETISILKDRLALALLSDSRDEQAAIIDFILFEIKKHVVPIKLNRSTPRNKHPRKAKFRHNQKFNC